MRNPYRVSHNGGGDIYTGRCDGVAEFHGVIYLVDQEAALIIFKHIYGYDAVAHCTGGRRANRVQLRRDRAVGRLSATSGIGDPVF